jgi:formylglycine-generating enzyme required for sulfatase activity
LTPGIAAVFQDAPFAPEMAVIPPGRFTMGSPKDEPGRYGDEGPRHEVTIPRPLAVGRYAVTFEEWDFAQDDKDWAAATGTKPRKPNDEQWGRGRRPVIDVSWDDAKAYATWLSHRTGQAYRLLSEAEWEYACRAGTATPFSWGGSITPEQANYNGDFIYEGGGAKGEYRAKTVPVDSFEPNPWGLYQMHGNVWEWCEDHWRDSYKKKPERLKVTGGAWTTRSGGSRVLRGGAWDVYPAFLRAAVRGRGDSGGRSGSVGFRVARTLNP